ncbi:MAG: S41 family peptidase [Polyangiaceae bacterium]|jgi:carboxyl-terminal processing protease
MLPASNSGVGMNMGFPDVCVTPVGPVPTPIPYPNMALNATAVPFAATVLISFVPGLNIGAEMPMTLGDQAGVESPFMGPGRYTTGNPTVMVEALPGVNLLCPTTGNDFINALGAVTVPSITNVFFTRAGGPRGAIDAAAMAELSRAFDVPAPAEVLSPEGVALVGIPVFSPGVPARVYSAVSRWGGDRVRALVVDLRGCPGGELTSALELAGDFLPEGAAILTVTDGQGDDTVYRARGVHPYRFPLVVLVDRGTASAAEVFAGALQAHGRAVVVGERTFGKGTAQTLMGGLAEPGASYATVATLTLPDGEPLEGRGIRPDVEVPPGDALAIARAAIATLFSEQV